MRAILFILATLGCLWTVAAWADFDAPVANDGVPGLFSSNSGLHVLSCPHPATPAEMRLSYDFQENRFPGHFNPAAAEPGESPVISGLRQWMAAARSESDPAPDVNTDLDPMESEDAKRWSSFLPLMAEEVEKRGIELPLPFGVSFNTVLLRRDVEVKEVAGAINGPPQDLSDFIGIDTNNSVSSLALRLDAWLLPFLNLYALGGYVQNSPNLSLTLTVPTLLPPRYPGGHHQYNRRTGRFDSRRRHHPGGRIQGFLPVPGHQLDLCRYGWQFR